MAARSKSTKRGKKRGLTPKQAAFVEEYLVDGNGTRAAIAAGYSKHSARTAACDNLMKPYIAEAIAQAQRARSERVEFTADDVVRGLISFVEGEQEDALAKDRVRCFELLGKHLGMFKPVGGADNPLHVKSEPIDLSGWGAEDLRALSKLQAKVRERGAAD